MLLLNCWEVWNRGYIFSQSVLCFFLPPRCRFFFFFVVFCETREVTFDSLNKNLVDVSRRSCAYMFVYLCVQRRMGDRRRRGKTEQNAFVRHWKTVLGLGLSVDAFFQTFSPLFGLPILFLSGDKCYKNVITRWWMDYLQKSEDTALPRVQMRSNSWRGFVGWCFSGGTYERELHGIWAQRC